MILTDDIKSYMDKSVLCWLATADLGGIPNVSPKEIFTYGPQDTILVANIASPQTVKNIRQNEHVCISFIDILVQKGYQLKGKAIIMDESHAEYATCKEKLFALAGHDFPFKSITKIIVEKAKAILAPRYLLFPETEEKDQIARAKKAYNLDR